MEKATTRPWWIHLALDTHDENVDALRITLRAYRGEQRRHGGDYGDHDRARYVDLVVTQLEAAAEVYGEWGPDGVKEWRKLVESGLDLMAAKAAVEAIHADPDDYI